MIAVFADQGRYRVAIAELPLSARVAERPEGAIVVVPGKTGWPGAMIAAARSGAMAIILADPVLVPAADVQRVIAGVDIPVIVDRPLVRVDVSAAALDARATTAGGATVPPRIVVVDATAPRSALGSVARDAVGWARVLTGEQLEVVSSDSGQVLLAGASGLAATLAVVATARPGSGRIHGQALGEVITDVVVEGRIARLTTSTETGRLIAPAVFESSARLALRRALAAVQGVSSRDLEELAADTAIAETIIVARA